MPSSAKRSAGKSLEDVSQWPSATRKVKWLVAIVVINGNCPDLLHLIANISQRYVVVGASPEARGPKRKPF